MTCQDGLLSGRDALNNLVNSSEDLLSASSGGRVSQVQGRQRVYSIGLLPWSTSTETPSHQSLSLSSFLSLSLCSHALSDPQAQGCPLHMPEEKKQFNSSIRRTIAVT